MVNSSFGTFSWMQEYPEVSPGWGGWFAGCTPPVGGVLNVVCCIQVNSWSSGSHLEVWNPALPHHRGHGLGKSSDPTGSRLEKKKPPCVHILESCSGVLTGERRAGGGKSKANPNPEGEVFKTDLRMYLYFG